MMFVEEDLLPTLVNIPIIQDVLLFCEDNYYVELFCFVTKLLSLLL